MSLGEIPRYAYHPTEAFSSKLEKIRKRDPSGHARIHEVIGRLLENPQDADGWMHGVYNGKLKKYVGRRDYRLIYQWCLECRKTRKQLDSHCGACGDVTDRSVIFYDVYHKNEQDAHLRAVG